MKTEFQNSGSKPHVFYIEPFGEDYTMLCGEEFALEVDGEGVWLHIDRHDDQTSVYIEGGFTDFKVVQDGRVLQCGHQRQNRS
ncbi:MAG: hypothetical protein GC159_23935 [Phycisphaera sp.]|nr:hypothetical protein [Phycisphaera sp.]